MYLVRLKSDLQRVDTEWPWYWSPLCYSTMLPPAQWKVNCHQWDWWSGCCRLPFQLLSLAESGTSSDRGTRSRRICNGLLSWHPGHQVKFHLKCRFCSENTSTAFQKTSKMRTACMSSCSSTIWNGSEEAWSLSWAAEGLERLTTNWSPNCSCSTVHPHWLAWNLHSKESNCLFLQPKNHLHKIQAAGYLCISEFLILFFFSNLHDEFSARKTRSKHSQGLMPLTACCP